MKKLYCIIYIPTDKDGCWYADCLSPSLEYVERHFKFIQDNFENNIVMGYYDIEEMIQDFKDDPDELLYDDFDGFSIITSDCTDILADEAGHHLYLLK